MEQPRRRRAAGPASVLASRREIIAALGPAWILALSPAARAEKTSLSFGPPSPFSFEDLKAKARTLARRPFIPRPVPVPARLKAVDFDAVGQIHYRPDAALWREPPPGGEIEFFHLGRDFPTPVTLHVVEAGQAREINYSPSLFTIPKGNPAQGLPEDLGFAGFRAMNPDGASDWLAYLGAAYFRAATPFNQFGLSARGLAIDTATSRPEEFPAFTTFWLARDPDGALIVHALLDGPSVAGAYRITHRKTDAGLVQEIETTLNFRASVQRLGVAPLTSMFWYGQSDRPPTADWRPQIHDSDGLAIWTGAGERIWRPLKNPPRVVSNAFLDTHPRGFGLMQRDRAFADYEDDAAFYERRPSVWVEPLGDWGRGSVQLVEIPTADENHDNIVAFWTPERPVKAGEALAFHYRLHWRGEEPTPVGVARVVATRAGLGSSPGQARVPGLRKFAVDFAGGRLPGLGRQSGVQSVVTVSGGQALGPTAYPVVGTDRWRLIFEVAIKAGNTIDLRAFLRLGADSLTETWIYQAFG
jgi:glucans biosynthesis protein